MPYVCRDDSGEIAGVALVQSATHEEFVENGDYELSFYLQGLSQSNDISDTDQNFVRVLEDVVEVLIAKGLILFTDLPPSAQEKVMNRQRLRKGLVADLNLVEDD